MKQISPLSIKKQDHNLAASFLLSHPFSSALNQFERSLISTKAGKKTQRSFSSPGGFRSPVLLPGFILTVHRSTRKSYSIMDSPICVYCRPNLHSHHLSNIISSLWLSNDTCAGAQRRLPDPAVPLQHFHLASCRCYSESQMSKARVCQHDSGGAEKCHGLCSRR